MNGKLPDQAYAALAALKAQAAAATGMLVDGQTAENKRLMAEAQNQMAANQPWTNRIFKALMKGDDSLTIDSADEEWLEAIFLNTSN